MLILLAVIAAIVLGVGGRFFMRWFFDFAPKSRLYRVVYRIGERVVSEHVTTAGKLRLPTTAAEAEELATRHELSLTGKVRRTHDMGGGTLLEFAVYGSADPLVIHATPHVAVPA